MTLEAPSFLRRQESTQGWGGVRPLREAQKDRRQGRERAKPKEPTQEQGMAGGGYCPNPLSHASDASVNETSIKSPIRIASPPTVPILVAGT